MYRADWKQPSSIQFFFQSFVLIEMASDAPTATSPSANLARHCAKQIYRGLKTTPRSTPQRLVSYCRTLEYHLSKLLTVTPSAVVVAAAAAAAAGTCSDDTRDGSSASEGKSRSSLAPATAAAGSTLPTTVPKDTAELQPPPPTVDSALLAQWLDMESSTFDTSGATSIEIEKWLKWTRSLIGNLTRVIEDEQRRMDRSRGMAMMFRPHKRTKLVRFDAAPTDASWCGGW
jgi:hypothetical protein